MKINSAKGVELVLGDVLQPDEIMARALSRKPVAIYAAFSGGDDSLVTTHWMMANFPGCKVAHFNTGIGLKITRHYVRDTCEFYGWDLTEIRAKEDCGQNYEEMVLKFGFPGPAMHHRMYQRLKERPVRKLVKQCKRRVRDKVLIATGIRRDESLIRMGYAGREVNFVGSQMWVNPMYWWTKQSFIDYRNHHSLRRNPVAEMLGLSGECLCGAHAHKGELALIRLVEPETANYLEDLQRRVRAAGHDWGWEDRPPRSGELARLAGPMCVGCDKQSAIAFAGLADSVT
jgi:3'-phosphoadenosine 5'-phosphosulfate sulfotransferase (PAPS reductase)/FAD synthetase